MSPTVFLTGATGYIGGDVLHELVSRYPNCRIEFLVRDGQRGREIEAKYPSTTLLLGDLHATETIEQAASRADIVLHLANCDHADSASAIVRGLSKRKAQRPGDLIHCSGALSLSTETIDRGCFGETNTKIFDDWDGLEDLTSLPDHAEHRTVDKIVLEASKLFPEKIRTAIVSPPLIYGRGRGLHNQRSKQIYRLVESFMIHDRAFTIGAGQSVWHQVHIKDLSRLFVSLAEAAMETITSDAERWNDGGYYLAENGSFVWREIIRALTDILKERGLLSCDRIHQLSADEANKLMPYAKYMIGTNSRGRAIRARKLLAWNPTEQSLTGELPAIIESEVLRLGMTR